MKPLVCPSTFRHTAAAILARALIDLLPFCQLVKSECGTFEFGWTIQSDQPFTEELLRSLEDRMLQLRQSDSIRLMEMVPVSASEYFLSIEQEVLSESYSLSEKQLVGLMQINGLRVPVELPCEESVGKIKAFKLIGFQALDDCVQINGVVFPDSEALKQFGKLWRSAEKNRKKKWEEQLELFHNEILLPRGERLSWILNTYLRDFFTREGFQYIVGTVDDLVEVSKVYGYERVGIWKSPTDFRGLVYSSKENILGLLHSCAQLIKILNLEHLFIVSDKRDPFTAFIAQSFDTLTQENGNDKGPSVTVAFLDEVGRPFSLVQIQKWQDSDGFQFSVTFALREFFMNWVRQLRGILPFCFAPDQIQVIQLHDEARDYTVQFMESCARLGYRAVLAEPGESLEAAIYKGEKLKVPYQVCIGKREMERGTVSVRERGNSSENAVAFDKFFVEYGMQLSFPQLNTRKKELD